jgi:hypothetical protein
MRGRALLGIGIFAFAAVALADGLPQEVIEQARRFSHVTAAGGQLSGDGDPPRFAISVSSTVVSPTLRTYADAKVSFGELSKPLEPITVGRSADGKTVWIGEDIEYAPDHTTTTLARVHATGLFDDGQLAVAWHLGEIAPPQGKKAAPIELLKLAKQIDPGAEAPAALFAKTIGDPAALAKTVSSRADTVMYGPEAADHFAGGAAIKSQLATWQLKFTIRDGVQAGVADSKTTAFVAAHVDARKPDGSVTPYRLMIIYDKVGADWQLVALHFSRAIDNS